MKIADLVLASLGVGYDKKNGDDGDARSYYYYNIGGIILVHHPQLPSSSCLLLQCLPPQRL